MKVYACYNIKGGVGKTTTAINLAYLSARDSNRTLLWDLDPQGAATFLLRVRPRVKGGGSKLIHGRRALPDAIKGSDFANLDLLPADVTYRNMDLALDDSRRPSRRLGQLLEPLAADYDVIVLDCPPTMSLVSENILHSASTVLVPLIPTTLSMRTFDQLTDFNTSLRGPQPGLLGFFSMLDRRKKQHRDVVETNAHRDDIAHTTIPALSVIEQMGHHRAPLPSYAPRSAAAARYEQLWTETQNHDH